MRLTFMGTGTSMGVPVIGCRCETCTSADPRNMRTRSSLLVESDKGLLILIDTATELRLQAVREGLDHLDVILYTHGHADHIHGLDDIRRFNYTAQGPLPCYGNPATIDLLEKIYHYCFNHDMPGPLPLIETHVMLEPTQLGDARVAPIPIFHGQREIYGYRINDCAYITDCSGIPDSSMPLLQGLKTLIVGALRIKPHPTHFSVEQAVEVIQRLKPERAFLTHLSHQLEHNCLSKMLPPGIEAAYDGLRIEV